MEILGLRHHALAMGAAAALLAGCGGSQPPIGAQSQARAAARHVSRTAGSSDDLLYVGSFDGRIYVFTYPDARYVISLFPPEPSNISGLCTDPTGDVFAVGYFDDGWIFKYLHGATTPVSTIALGYSLPTSCSVDRTTGNLAVLMSKNGRYNTAVAIFPKGSGTPTYYTVPNAHEELSLSCTYDDSGNLFVEYRGTDGALDLAELRAGDNSFTALSPSARLQGSTLQWTSPYLVIAKKGIVYRLSISGSTVTVAGHTRVTDGRANFWIQDGQTLIAPYGPNNKLGHVTEVGMWKYPKGGKAFHVIHRVNKSFVYISSIVVSAAPN